jgi:RNA polymerase sigma-70 factor (ECF subfamily)
MTDADAELVIRAKRGDRVALELLCRRHIAGVWRYAWFRTHSREAAAEIVQETFLRVTRFVGKFDGRSRFGTWLFALVRSVSIEFARRERLRRRLDTEQRIIRFVAARPAFAPTANESSESHDDSREAVRVAVAGLPGPQRDAVVLCELSDMTIAEAAVVLGWSEGRVKSTLFRARRRLRDSLMESDNAHERRSEEATAAYVGATKRRGDEGKAQSRRGLCPAGVQSRDREGPGPREKGPDASDHGP